MDWVTCPNCGFTQIPTEKCLRCSRPLERPEPPAVRPSPPDSDAVATLVPSSVEPAPATPPDPLRRPERPPPPPPDATTAEASRIRPATAAAIGAGVALLVALLILAVRPRALPPLRETSPAAPAAAPSRLDLSGRWETEFPKTLSSPARPALKKAFVETDGDGAILAAGVLLTDPGRGGVGAGYRLVSDGPQRLGRISSLLAASPAGAALPIDYIPFPAWVPSRERVWRALEGQSRRVLDVRYLLLESVEDDYLVQAGVNQSGFLSYVFFSREYARHRGVDALSDVIHPEPGSDLRGFRNLVWDLSGAADFLKLEVYGTLSGPEGGPGDRLTLKRK
ncbi:MAG: hypothetical protein LC796_15975 [Acidobacteria bacterium]|nr:hypothetical protein [Acidobacteriota bacterium]MCA1609589.1 hypothetical protein [Acidobacteriota bacterium]